MMHHPATGYTRHWKARRRRELLRRARRIAAFALFVLAVGVVL